MTSLRILTAAAIIMAGSAAWAASVTWDDDSTDGLWSTNANWSDDVNGVQTGDTAVFDDTTAGGTSTMDETSPFTLGKLHYNHTAGASQTLGLSSNTLVVADEFRSGWAAGSSTVANTVTVGGNGTLQFGSVSNDCDVYVGYNKGSGADRGFGDGTLTVQSGTTVDFKNVATLHIGHNEEGTWYSAVGTMDLSAATVAELVAGDVYIGVGGCHNGASQTHGTLLLPTGTTKIEVNSLTMGLIGKGAYGKIDLGSSSSQLNTLTVADTLCIGNGDLGYDDGSGNYVLPAGVAVSVGSTAHRGTLDVGRITNWTHASGSLALSGGSFDATLETLRVGYDPLNYWVWGSATGELDLSATTVTTFDVTDMYVGWGEAADGTVKLPACTATAENLSVGIETDELGHLMGYLELNDTAFTVEDVFNMGEVGAANIQLNFTWEGGYFQVMGDRIADFTQYLADDRITSNVDDSELAVYMADDYTRVWYGPVPGADIPEPATLALLGVGALGLLARRRRRA